MYCLIVKLLCFLKKVKRLLELYCRIVKGLIVGEDVYGGLRIMIMSEVDEYYKVIREFIEMSFFVV